MMPQAVAEQDEAQVALHARRMAHREVRAARLRLDEAQRLLNRVEDAETVTVRRAARMARTVERRLEGSC